MILPSYVIIDAPQEPERVSSIAGHASDVAAACTLLCVGALLLAAVLWDPPHARPNKIALRAEGVFPTETNQPAGKPGLCSAEARR